MSQRGRASPGRTGRASHAQDDAIDKFIVGIKRSLQHDREGRAAMDVAKDVAEILRSVLARRGTSFEQLMFQVRDAGRRMMEASPFTHLVANVTRRVLYIMRHEYQETKREHLLEEGDEPTPDPRPPRISPGRDGSSSGMLWSTRNPVLESRLLNPAGQELEQDHAPPPMHKLKNNLMEHLNNSFIDEFNAAQKTIARQGLDHIADQDVLLTFGRSSTVEKFLIFAGGERKGKRLNFEVFVCEAAPDCSGHLLVAKLSEAGIKATLIPDSAAFAVMGRISKVIVGTHLVLADGGLIAPAGTNNVAVAASMHSVPVLVLTPLIKLTPAYVSASEVESYIVTTRDPGEVLPFDSVTAAVGTQSFLGHTGAPELAVVHNVSAEHVAPDLVSLFVTDKSEREGGAKSFAPSYIYRLLQQFYNPEDNII
eukprot:TRINITY_DN40417_c0_g1_i1.p1 TRINITY_DN40417_c0_g1~~TRINITY_DN40417_c0_g1_i1.p1  ORF type:complete len:424 (+),score=141.60 TRINITY_DN40417_c0_g1_i1:58-1329(+)